MADYERVFSPSGAMCRRTPVNDPVWTGPICACGVVECKAGLMREVGVRMADRPDTALDVVIRAAPVGLRVHPEIVAKARAEIERLAARLSEAEEALAARALVAEDELVFANAALSDALARLSEYEQALRAADALRNGAVGGRGYVTVRRENYIAATTAARAALSGSAGSGP